MPNELTPDFLELIESLTLQNVEFLVVGAHALAFLGVARYTQDLDLWVSTTAENIQKLHRAFSAFGLPLPEEQLKELATDRKFLRLGHEPSQVDILNFLDGCQFDVAYARAQSVQMGDATVKLLSLEDYVATKRASGRPKDESDLTLLRSMIGPLPGD